MRVVILTEGGPGVGYGHLSRCSSVAEELAALGCSVEVFVQGPPTCLAFFSSGALISDWIDDLKLAKRLCAGSHCAIVDSYKPDLDFYQFLFAEYPGLSVFFDDLGSPKGRSGIVVNGAPHASTLYKQMPNTVLLAGCEYQAMRPAFRNCPMRRCAAEPRRLLVTLGGDDIHALAPGLYQRLSNAPEGWILTFISTQTSRTREYLQSITHSPHRLVVDADGPTMCRELQAADIGVVAAGQTTFETARTGLPVVVIQVADNQRELINGWNLMGYTPFVFNWTEIQRPEVLEDALRQMSPQLLRAGLAAIGQRAVDGQGGRRIASKIKELAGHA